MPVKSVDVKTLKLWIDNDEVVIIDVREPSEHRATKIQGSILLPLGTISASSLPKTHGKKLVFHCGMGKRSASACEKLLAENPNLEVYNLDGGITAWSSLTHKGSISYSLDRQVQIIVGICVLAGTVLTYFFGTIFCLVTGFFGVGLIFAGLTGFCGLRCIMTNIQCKSSKSHD
jgi:rhodanese-related sulfurtransferase